MKKWRYEIQHGPDGEQNYAFVFDGNNVLVSNLKLHHAIAVVAAMNAYNSCHWYWPADDTSSEMCAGCAPEVVQNAYEWDTPTGEVIEVSRGGVVETTFCASLPPADDSDSDDEFWVEEDTLEAAKAKIEAERERRAALSPDTTEQNDG